ncbi:hypothetical protein Y032_0225g2743 [Ancylostoma ceylanicum]|uniref:Uncharacterized protein n=1 Tax=Ancylostoma ceylanicum TaxID=53326 RepID=A0A016SH50_9BILA|nr:hypothetical protein Y032_0225g2743 [Ancylostoma ceylanicum]
MPLAASLALITYLFFHIAVLSCIILNCGADKNREKVHVQRRQELKNLQRDAVLAGRPVQTVIEEVEPLMMRSTSRLSCVRDMPDMASLEKAQRAKKKGSIQPQREQKEDFTPIKSMECAQDLAKELSELHDLVGTNGNKSVMNCSGINFFLPRTSKQ